MDKATMNESAAKTLLALLLALNDTEVRLSHREESALEEIRHRLNQRSDTWESIEKNLMAVIQENANLNQAYQKIRPELDEMDNEELLELVPNEPQLGQTTPSPSSDGFLGPKPSGSPHGKYITNTVREILTGESNNEEPPQNVKKTSLLTKLKSFFAKK